MGELTKPIMSPLGVIYRSFHESEAHALKSASWAVKLFGGTAAPFNTIGPGTRGYYEAGMMLMIPPTAQCMKARKTPEADTEWQTRPEHGYVLYDALETPIAVYFHKHDLICKPLTTPPMTAFFVLSLDQ